MTATGTPVSAALASVLASGRAHFNTRAAEARHRYPAFDTTGFAAFLRTGVDGIAVSVAGVAPERTAQAVLAAYDMALELVAQGLAGPGARTVAIERAWVDLAPRFARLIAVQPVEVLGALSNAAIHIASEPAARFDDWLEDMAALAAQADSVERLRSLGAIAAWRAGLPHFRESALREAGQLPEPLALMALHAPPGLAWAEVRDAHRANRWWSPQPQRREVHRRGLRIGAFTGFGGTFSQPPSVRACQEGFLVRSGDRFSLLVADAYGAVLLPATAREYADADIVIGGLRIASELPEDGLSLAGNGHTVAVTSPYTHSIRLFPATEPAP
jgi:hypothetical protein